MIAPYAFATFICVVAVFYNVDVKIAQINVFF